MNQTPEQTEEQSLQVSLPPLKGHIEYENKLQIWKYGPSQVDKIDLKIDRANLLESLVRAVVVRVLNETITEVI